MRRKAIFGGTFDPIHNGHLHIAYEALRVLDLEKLLFMPSGNPPHKKEKKITDGTVRYEMVKMAIRREGRFEVSEYEMKEEGYSFTYRTVEYFKDSEPEIEWYFITGVDCLMDLGLWKNVERIMKAATLVVFSRPGYEKEEILRQKEVIEKKYNKEILFLDMPLLDISSSYIKQCIKEDKFVGYLMPEGVYNMATELAIYR